MSASFFSCEDTGFFHEDRFNEDLVYLLYVLTSMMTSYCAKLCVRVNVQLFGFYIPTIVGLIMSFLLSGPGSIRPPQDADVLSVLVLLRLKFF